VNEPALGFPDAAAHDIAVDGVCGILTELTGQIIDTQVEVVRDGFQRDILCIVPVDITADFLRRTSGCF